MKTQQLIILLVVSMCLSSCVKDPDIPAGKTFGCARVSVTTYSVYSITQTTAKGGGSVDVFGSTKLKECGICWGTSHNPTINDSHISDGSDTGGFFCDMTDLSAGTTYYVRAYAINGAGVVYGQEESFTTNPPDGEFTITVSANPNSGGVVYGGGKYNKNQTCTLSAIASNGYIFNYWKEGEQLFSVEANYSFPVNGNKTLVAYFTPIQTYTVSASANPIDCGIVTGGGSYQWGHTCTITATANEGYTFINWTENDAQVSSNSSYTFTVMSNRSLVANFTTNEHYAINISANPSDGGMVNGGGIFQQGQTCMVTATANSGYVFTNWTENESIVSTSNNYSFVVNTDKTLVANFEEVPIGAINGLFTINDNGDQVYFSQGNLQYQASTGTWRFAENQWDFVGTQNPPNGYPSGGTINGSDNHNISQSNIGWIDLFGWGTSGYNHGANCYQPWSTSINTNDYYAYGNSSYNLFNQTGKADWGYNAINNGDNSTHIWRTLIKDESIYVFVTRNTPSGIRYAKAIVNDVNGVILLPDNCSENCYSLSNANQSGAFYSSNVISESIWNISFQPYGAVFLPAGGRRGGTAVMGVGSSGCYWLASCQSYNNAYETKFDNASFQLQDGDFRNYGQSVRLVQDYQH